MNNVAPKLTRERAPWLFEGPLLRLLDVLNADGEEARAVGGAVRNALMNLPVGEVDVATTATPDAVSQRVKAAGMHAVPTGIEHGTVTVVIGEKPFEVTTLRQDVETDGRHAVVKFGRDWKADAERRDFTINALSADRTGQVFDFTGGVADIEAKRVRFIGDPATRIAEDYLRILRFFRFHAAYGEGVPDAAGLAACIRARAGLAQLSRERVRAELMKLLVAQHATPTLATMSESGILTDVLAGVPWLASFSNMAKAEAEYRLDADPVRRLAALGVRVLVADRSGNGAGGAAGDPLSYRRGRLSRPGAARLVARRGKGRRRRLARTLCAARGMGGAEVPVHGEAVSRSRRGQGAGARFDPRAR